MMLTLAKQQYLLGLVFTLNNEKRENEEIGYCDFELKNMLLTFFVKKQQQKRQIVPH